MAESGAAEGSPPSAHNVHPAETAVSATATATATGLPENHQDAADTPSDPPSEENGAVASEAAAEFNDDQGDQGEVEPGEVEPGEDGDGDGDGDGDSDGDGARDTSRFIAHGDSKSVAPRIKDSHWEAHKDKILKHYVAENNTLDALMEIMDREYSFKPSTCIA
ncbi:hypothetical protein B0T26DRAFT_333723 [Lasiosphaeria miniovina]|uniref:Clr5 domain-containing protein n=1 Tax=Lasiosphaeria miniovina TaxID=1954250 RepID=A0AA40AMH7_9PEZI|nr:uncharacterized protein B0T26DRAFT_333723 [Lasiosphaeria miniovina]KAK0718598.1 hypothetical protein B0T26DRAFT_333723 [Lasiosphaeria miniovina]